MVEDSPDVNPDLSDILGHCELFTSLSHADLELIADLCAWDTSHHISTYYIVRAQTTNVAI